jgi:integrase/recombinase XerD
MDMIWWASGEGPLAAYAAGYRGALERRGFSPRAVRDRMEVAGQLDRWLAGEGLSAADLAVARAGQFFAALRAGRQRRVPAMPTLAPLFAYLRDQQVLPPEQAAGTPAGELLASYRRYLVAERGVAPLTVLRYERMARRFLAGRLPRAGVQTGAEDLCGPEVIGYLAACCSRLRTTGSAKREAADLRSLLRFLAASP